MNWLKALLEKATIQDGVLDIDGLVAAIKTEFPKNAVPKSDFNVLNGTKKDLEQQIKNRDKQLKDLQDKLKGSDDLEKTIKDLQEVNKTIKETYEAKLKDMAINYAIQAKLTNTKYPELLMNKFDKAKLSVADDGTVSGIDEQLTSLKEQYKDLFTLPIAGRDPKGGAPSVRRILGVENISI